MSQRMTVTVVTCQLTSHPEPSRPFPVRYDLPGGWMGYYPITDPSARTEKSRMKTEIAGMYKVPIAA